MKIPGLIALCLFSALLRSDAAADAAAGLVYGPTAAFEIYSPKGWILDNQSGRAQGLPCVLYPKGSQWTDAEVKMYAKLATPDLTNAEEFARLAIAYMSAVPGFTSNRVQDGKTRDGHTFFVNEYRRSVGEGRFERVAYIQLPEGVAYIGVLAPSEAAYQNHAAVLSQTIKSFAFRPEFINFLPQKLPQP